MTEFTAIVRSSEAGRFGCFDASSAIDATITTPRSYAASIAACACGGLVSAPSASCTTSAPESSANKTPAAKRPPSATNESETRIGRTRQRGQEPTSPVPFSRGRVFGFTGAVAVLDGVEGIVVSVEEVPTRDVVDVAVAVVVIAVAVLRIEDEIFGIGDRVAVAVGDRAEVRDVEHAVAVAVARCSRTRRAGLSEVDVRRGREVGHAVGVSPHDPRVEHRDEHVVAALVDTPREVDGRTLLTAQVLR